LGSNFSSKEHVKKCPNKRGFRQKMEAIEECVVVSAPSKRAYMA
jgi:hypothetical protein